MSVVEGVVTVLVTIILAVLFGYLWVKDNESQKGGK